MDIKRVGIPLHDVITQLRILKDQVKDTCGSIKANPDLAEDGTLVVNYVSVKPCKGLHAFMINHLTIVSAPFMSKVEQMTTSLSMTLLFGFLSSRRMLMQGTANMVHCALNAHVK